MSIVDGTQLGSGCNAGRDTSSSPCSASQRKLSRVPRCSGATTAAEAASVSVRPAGSTEGSSERMERRQTAEPSHDQSHDYRGDTSRAGGVCMNASGSTHDTEQVIILDSDDLECDNFEDEGPLVTPTTHIHAVGVGLWERGEARDGKRQSQSAEPSHDQSHDCHGDTRRAAGVCMNASGSAHMTELEQEVIILDPDDLEVDSFEDKGPPVTTDIHTVGPGVWERGGASDDLSWCCGSVGGGGGGEGKVGRIECRSVGEGVFEEEGWRDEEGGRREEEEEWKEWKKWKDEEENEEAFPEFDNLVGEFDSAEDFFTQVTNNLHFEHNSNHW